LGKLPDLEVTRRLTAPSNTYQRLPYAYRSPP